MNLMQTVMEKKFLIHFKNFKNFKEKEYKPYWELCFDSLLNRDFFTYMVLCNDLNGIPPVKSFLLYHEDSIRKITANKECELDNYARRSLGAFFAMLFQNILGFDPDKTKIVRVSMQKFGLSTASVYKK
jgi:hypothetical protein